MLRALSIPSSSHCWRIRPENLFTSSRLSSRGGTLNKPKLCSSKWRCWSMKDDWSSSTAPGQWTMKQRRTTKVLSTSSRTAWSSGRRISGNAVGRESDGTSIRSGTLANKRRCSQRWGTMECSWEGWITATRTSEQAHRRWKWFGSQVTIWVRFHLIDFTCLRLTKHFQMTQICLPALCTTSTPHRPASASTCFVTTSRSLTTSTALTTMWIAGYLWTLFQEILISFLFYQLAAFKAYVDQQAAAYRTNNVILTMGEDFFYLSAEVWFKNMDKLIK